MSQDVSPAQTIAVTALLAGQSISEAAEAAGVDRRTVHRWKHEDGFSEALADGQREIMAECSDRLAALAERAVSAVEKAVVEDQSPTVALRVLDGLGLLTRSFAVAVSSPHFDTGIPPRLEADDAERVIEMARVFSGKEPPTHPPPSLADDPAPDEPPAPVAEALDSLSMAIRG